MFGKSHVCYNAALCLSINEFYPLFTIALFAISHEVWESLQAIWLHECEMKRVIRMNAKKEMCCKNKITVQYVKNDNENLFWND